MNNNTLYFAISHCKCTCTSTNIHIENSYIIPNNEVERFLRVALDVIDGEFTYRRSLDSWVREWVAHNRLYKLGLFRKHTKDLDLDEFESKFRLFIYNIIGR